ncbi:hypothetical protein ACROYT_G003959 [Oculina patagonica]
MQDVWDATPHKVIRRLDTGITYVVVPLKASTGEGESRKTVHRNDILHATQLADDMGLENSPFVSHDGNREDIGSSVLTKAETGNGVDETGSEEGSDDGEEDDDFELVELPKHSSAPKGIPHGSDVQQALNDDLGQSQSETPKEDGAKSDQEPQIAEFAADAVADHKEPDTLQTSTGGYEGAEVMPANDDTRSSLPVRRSTRAGAADVSTLEKGRFESFCVFVVDQGGRRTNLKYINNHYQQIFGTATGSTNLSTSLSQQCFWKRYVDDVCATVKSNLVLTLQNHLNNIEPSIQFTVERETERKVSFLDVTVCRQDDGKLCTKVYRKPTHTERYLSFDSHHPAAHKRAVVKSFTDRAKTIPSSVDQQSKEMKPQHVTAALRANGYPKRFVIDVSKPKRPFSQTPATAPDDKKGFCTLPYVKGTTEPIKRILSNYNIKVALKPHQTIGNLFPKPKDPVPKDQTRGAIYSIPCQDCDKSYIGETKRKFSTRLKEHQKAVEDKHSHKSALTDKDRPSCRIMFYQNNVILLFLKTHEK